MKKKQTLLSSLAFLAGALLAAGIMMLLFLDGGTSAVRAEVNLSAEQPEVVTKYITQQVLVPEEIIKYVDRIQYVDRYIDRVQYVDRIQYISQEIVKYVDRVQYVDRIEYVDRVQYVDRYIYVTVPANTPPMAWGNDDTSNGKGPNKDGGK